MTSHGVSMRARIRVGLLAALCVAGEMVELGAGVPEAAAAPGRPAFAQYGMGRRSARRTARRTSRRTTRRNVAAYGGYGPTYVAPVTAVPAGCTVSGAVYHCGTTSYQPAFDGDEVVYVEE